MKFEMESQKSEMKSRKPKNAFLYFAVVALNLASFTLGMAFAWSSPSIPRLNGMVDPENNPLNPPLDLNQASWVTSIVALGATVSPFFAAMCSDKYGRKKTVLLFMIPIVIGFATLAFATNVILYYIARFLCGISIGAIYTVLPIYIGEIGTKHNRGALSCFIILILSLGSLLMYSMGSYVKIQTSCFICLIAPICFYILVTFFVPESPYYLVAQHRRDEALESLSKFRQMPPSCVEKELEEITDIVQESFMNKGTLLDMFRSRVLVKSLMIILGLVTFQQFSGVNCILLNLQTVFAASNGGNPEASLPPEVGSIIIGLTQFLSAIVTSSFVDRLGRRFLMMISAIGSMLSLVALGIFFYLLDNSYNIDSISLVPVISLVIFMMSYTFGFGPIPFTVLGEIFPPNIKAVASTLTISLCLLLAYINTMCFPYMVEAIGNAISFWFYGGCCGVAILYFYGLLPETKGKSLHEIQDMLNSS